jgi:hypothetical protein
MLVAAPGVVWNAELSKDGHEPVHWLWDGILLAGLLAGGALWASRSPPNR